MKRIFDLTTAISFSIIFLPLWIIIGFMIKINSKGPVFFRQERVGRFNNTFKIYKFRTMVIDAEKKGLQITVGAKDSRITSIGFLLRKTKLDELPQLFNIIKGEMSFVGPRPEVPRYVKFYTDKQREVLNHRPGITDVASIKYINENDLLKNSTDPEKMYIEEIMADKIKLNLEYLDKRSFFSDLFLIMRTILKVIM